MGFKERKVYKKIIEIKEQRGCPKNIARLQLKIRKEEGKEQSNSNDNNNETNNNTMAVQIALTSRVYALKQCCRSCGSSLQ